MKGEIVFKGDGKGIKCHAQIMLRSEIEAFELVSVMAKCVGVNDAESWAKCVIYCLSRVAHEPDGQERTEIRIPHTKEE